MEFVQVGGEILQKDPKLDLESCCAYVRGETQQRQIMGSSRPVPESSTTVVQCDRQRVDVFHHLEKQITLFAIIVVKKGTPNSVALILLNI